MVYIIMSILKYKDARGKPTTLIAMTGLNRNEFEKLLVYLRIGKTKILKNQIPESEPTPLGFWREALTNKRHNRTRSVRLMFRRSLDFKNKW